MDDVLAEAERIVENTPEAWGQRLGRQVAEEIDADLKRWIIAESARVAAHLRSLGLGDQTELVMGCVAKTLRRYADGMEH